MDEESLLGLYMNPSVILDRDMRLVNTGETFKFDIGENIGTNEIKPLVVEPFIPIPELGMQGVLLTDSEGTTFIPTNTTTAEEASQFMGMTSVGTVPKPQEVKVIKKDTVDKTVNNPEYVKQEEKNLDDNLMNNIIGLPNMVTNQQYNYNSLKNKLAHANKLIESGKTEEGNAYAKNSIIEYISNTYSGGNIELAEKVYNRLTNSYGVTSDDQVVEELYNKIMSNKKEFFLKNMFYNYANKKSTNGLLTGFFLESTPSYGLQQRVAGFLENRNYGIMDYLDETVRRDYAQQAGFLSEIGRKISAAILEVPGGLYYVGAQLTNVKYTGALMGLNEMSYLLGFQNKDEYLKNRYTIFKKGIDRYHNINKTTEYLKFWGGITNFTDTTTSTDDFTQMNVKDWFNSGLEFASSWYTGKALLTTAKGIKMTSDYLSKMGKLGTVAAFGLEVGTGVKVSNLIGKSIHKAGMAMLPSTFSKIDDKLIGNAMLLGMLEFDLDKMNYQKYIYDSLGGKPLEDKLSQLEWASFYGKYLYGISSLVLNLNEARRITNPLLPTKPEEIINLFSKKVIDEKFNLLKKELKQNIILETFKEGLEGINIEFAKSIGKALGTDYSLGQVILEDLQYKNFINKYVVGFFSEAIGAVPNIAVNNALSDSKSFNDLVQKYPLLKFVSVTSPYDYLRQAQEIRAKALEQVNNIVNNESAKFIKDIEDSNKILKSMTLNTAEETVDKNLQVFEKSELPKSPSPTDESGFKPDHKPVTEVDTRNRDKQKEDTLFKNLIGELKSSLPDLWELLQKTENENNKNIVNLFYDLNEVADFANEENLVDLLNFHSMLEQWAERNNAKDSDQFKKLRNTLAYKLASSIKQSIGFFNEFFEGNKNISNLALFSNLIYGVRDVFENNIDINSLDDNTKNFIRSIHNQLLVSLFIDKIRDKDGNKVLDTSRLLRSLSNVDSDEILFAAFMDRAVGKRADRYDKHEKLLFALSRLLDLDYRSLENIKDVIDINNVDIFLSIAEKREMLDENGKIDKNKVKKDFLLYAENFVSKYYANITGDGKETSARTKAWLDSMKQKMGLTAEQTPVETQQQGTEEQIREEFNKSIREARVEEELQKEKEKSIINTLEVMGIDDKLNIKDIEKFKNYIKELELTDEDLKEIGIKDINNITSKEVESILSYHINKCVKKFANYLNVDEDKIDKIFLGIIQSFKNKGNIIFVHRLYKFIEDGLKNNSSLDIKNAFTQQSYGVTFDFKMLLQSLLDFVNSDDREVMTKKQAKEYANQSPGFNGLKPTADLIYEEHLKQAVSLDNIQQNPFSNITSTNSNIPIPLIHIISSLASSFAGSENIILDPIDGDHELRYAKVMINEKNDDDELIENNDILYVFTNFVYRLIGMNKYGIEFFTGGKPQQSINLEDKMEMKELSSFLKSIIIETKILRLSDDIDDITFKLKQLAYESMSAGLYDDYREAINKTKENILKKIEKELEKYPDKKDAIMSKMKDKFNELDVFISDMEQSFKNNARIIMEHMGNDSYNPEKLQQRIVDIINNMDINDENKKDIYIALGSIISSRGGLNNFVNVFTSFLVKEEMKFKDLENLKNNISEERQFFKDLLAQTDMNIENENLGNAKKHIEDFAKFLKDNINKLNIEDNKKEELRIKLDNILRSMNEVFSDLPMNENYVNILKSVKNNFIASNKKQIGMVNHLESFDKMIIYRDIENQLNDFYNLILDQTKKNFSDLSNDEDFVKNVNDKIKDIDNSLAKIDEIGKRIGIVISVYKNDIIKVKYDMTYKKIEFIRDSILDLLKDNRKLIKKIIDNIIDLRDRSVNEDKIFQLKEFNKKYKSASLNINNLNITSLRIC